MLFADECPVGTSLCKNSTICLPQRSWCNKSPDCPEEDDESPNECCEKNIKNFQPDKKLANYKII